MHEHHGMGVPPRTSRIHVGLGNRGWPVSTIVLNQLPQNLRLGRAGGRQILRAEEIHRRPNHIVCTLTGKIANDENWNMPVRQVAKLDGVERYLSQGV